MLKKLLSLVFVLGLTVSMARAQTAEIVISLNEQFFDALLDAVFKNMNPPEFPLAMKEGGKSGKGDEETVSAGFENRNLFGSSFAESQTPKNNDQNAVCSQSIRLQREIDGVRTSVRFRDGRIFVPIAFTGNYNPPLIGCIEFSGVAETNIELVFDHQKQALVGRANVLNVNLSGTGGIGSSLLAGLVQGSIDKKINPLQIIQLDRVSFVVPIQNSGNLRMKAVGIKNEIVNGALNVRITYEFLKG